ncbi:hypothetical protein BAE44_0003595 [Dichanthelium oligosanthes]|uniref:EGF-like domain-containing protein n=1 Tax=Dichanthelium oligosanthes TaxID=888268 RepID=A0A1E5WDB4_9POAL|nr:hypothetical protein BAE44_0003595 [Dichanthelium oligosanthes]
MARAELLVLASVCAAAAAAVLLQLPHGAAAADGECGKVNCGMGTCSESGDDAFGFACQCKTGWSRYHLGGEQFPFLPCIIPNCTINQKCENASSPEPAPSPPPPPAGLLPPNFSIFDPCLMQYCGDGGACEKVTDFTHRCVCRGGYANLLNDTSYPCYQQCSLGTDCKGLGIDVINGSTPSTSPPAPFSFTVKKSGGGAAAPPSERLLELLLLISFAWLQAI